jgi:hypothetical protein
MNGFIKKTMTLLCMGGSAAIVIGCCDFKLSETYDHCWPDRYNYQADRATLETFGAQVSNGHVLDQTVWWYHFEPGTAILTKAGLDHLAYIARRRPEPDPHVYLQTAQDVVYDAAAPEKFVGERSRLDEDRRQAILRYLSADTAGRPMPFEVAVHDPSAVGISAPPMATTIKGNFDSFKGTMPSQAATGMTK